MLLSHPQVCGSGGEFQQVLRRQAGDPLTRLIVKLVRYVPIMVRERSDVFRPRNWSPRGPLTEFTRHRIDRVLYAGKIRARKAGQNQFKAENEPYLDDEIANARVLSKLVDGNIFLSQALCSMYPDATFFGLVRNGFAVCEGHIRRGANVRQIAREYSIGCQRMIADEKEIGSYHVLRYEDCIAEPVQSLQKICRLAKLDISSIKKVRLETKQVISQSGAHEYVQGASDKVVVWYTLEEMKDHFRSDANKNQIARLTPEQKKEIRAICRESLHHFGYD